MYADLPPEFAGQIKSLLPDSWEKFQAALQQPPVVSLRLNPKKQPAEKHTFTEKIPWCGTGYYLDHRPVFTTDPLFHCGSYYVQEASSMFVEQALAQTLDLSRSLNVLDLCAAPGGKSTHVLSLVSTESLVVSNEVIRSRATILTENIQKWGYPQSVTTSNDPADFQRLPGFFDVVIVDAPCSGEGLFRKDPESRKEWSPENVHLCSMRQRRILKDIWPAIKEGGILIYSTCTYNEQENENNLTWLAGECPAEFVSLHIPPSWGIEKSTMGGAVGYRFYPHRTKGEGFFMAVLQKKAPTEKLPRKATRLPVLPHKLKDEFSRWLQNPTHYEFIFRNDRVQFIPYAKVADIQLLADHLHLTGAGTFAAEMKREKLIPEASMALSTEINRSQFTNIELEADQALQFLRKEPPDIRNGKKGFALITYRGCALGWVNVLENRINNLYPSAWRIRMAG